MHIIPAAMMLLFHDVVYGRLGRRWLTRKIKKEDASDRSIEVERGNLLEVDQAINYGVNLNTYIIRTPNDAYTLLQLACWNDHSDAVARLLEVGGIDTHLGSELRKWTPLYIAARNGHVQCAQLLLDYGVDADQPTTGGITALFTASARGHADVVSILIDAGAKNEKGWMGMGPTDAARATGNDRVLRRLAGIRNTMAIISGGSVADSSSHRSGRMVAGAGLPPVYDDEEEGVEGASSEEDEAMEVWTPVQTPADGTS
jgi:hypothetical protein